MLTVAKHLFIFLYYVTIIAAQDDGQEIAALACASVDSVYEFSGQQGIIQTVNFPENYNNYEDCTWYINPSNVGSGKLVSLEVDSFETEDPYDTLKVFKGQGLLDEDLLYELSGTYSFGSYFPTFESTVTVKFHSDGSHSLAGVNVTYFLQDTTTTQLITQEACNATLQPAELTNSSATIIESLSFPLNYEPGEYCVWKLMPDNPPGGGFYLSVIQFQTGTDSLNIYFGDNVDGTGFDTSWTGTRQQGHSVYASSEIVSLEFQTAATEPGFQIVYYLSDAACLSSSAVEVLVDGYGELISPGYPYDVPESVVCNWLLRAADTQRITLIALDFSLNGDGKNCNDEYLEILDGDQGDAISIGKFCGNSTFGNFPSSSSALQINLKTHITDDDTGSFVPYGFKLSYEPY